MTSFATVRTITDLRAFLDTNIYIYATGEDERWRFVCQSIVRLARSRAGAFVTSAEVMQEILFVTGRGRRPERIGEALALCIHSVSGRVQPVYGRDVLAAARLAPTSALQTRDLIHLAVMERIGVTNIVSADRAFDRAPGITRLDPLEFDAWRESFQQVS